MADSKSRSVSNLPAAIQPTVEIPTIGTATNVGTGRAYNNGAATVAVTNPRGGRPVSYTATSTPGSFTATSATSPLTVTGLASGTAYTFAVTGTSFDGAVTSASSASNSITATTVPQAPTIGTFTDGGTGTSGTLSFTAGATGGSTITAYKYSTDGTNYTTASGTTSPLSITGLSVGSYTFRLRATNANGDSADSGTVSGTVLQPTAFESIATTTLTTTTATVTIDSIPSNYKHLQLRLLTRSSRASNNDDLNMIVNGITTTSYSSHRLYGDGTTANVIAASSATIIEQIGKMTGNTSTANIFGVTIIDILDYASTTKNKTIRAFNGIDQNTSSSYTFLTSGLFQSTNAITSLTFSCQVASFVSGTSIALYGIKG